MLASKEQERNALKKIQSIIESLGEDSYVGTALEGCLAIAEENITNDFSCSMKQCYETVKKELMQTQKDLKEAEKKLEIMDDLLTVLNERLEKEQEWEPYETDELSQEDYDRLKNACTMPLGNAAAVRLISERYGFSGDKIKILDTRRLYEINRHSRIRYSATTERKPYYYASDWNYIRFECCGYTYEAVNGDLNNVTL